MSRPHLKNTELPHVLRCTQCGVEKPLTEEFFGRRQLRGGSGWNSSCRDCRNKSRNTSRIGACRAGVNLQRREARLQLKRTLIYHYSQGQMTCGCCGFGEFDTLTLDHVSGGGRESYRAVFGGSNRMLYEWVRKNGMPEGFQILCANCNASKRDRGACQHIRGPWRVTTPGQMQYHKRRLKVLGHYSGSDIQCAACGELEAEFLQLDHVDDDGAEHRRSLGLKSGDELLRWCIRNGFPVTPRLQVLCANCNLLKRFAHLRARHAAKLLK